MILDFLKQSNIVKFVYIIGLLTEFSINLIYGLVYILDDFDHSSRTLLLVEKCNCTLLQLFSEVIHIVKFCMKKDNWPQLTLMDTSK